LVSTLPKVSGWLSLARSKTGAEHAARSAFALDELAEVVRAAYRPGLRRV
jgi:hypothetical protein